MVIRDLRPEEKQAFNALVRHPVQTWEWGEFKEKTGVGVVRLGIFDKQRLRAGYQLTFHPIPKTSYSVAYFPKGPLPDKQMLSALLKLGQEHNAILIKIEPNVTKEKGEAAIASLSQEFDLRPGKPIFTPYTFLIDLRRSETDLLASMKPKTRYNLHLAERNGVSVKENNSDSAFQEYLRLTRKTYLRQHFYAHDEAYHRKMWETLRPSGIAHLLTASWQDTILVAWIVFTFNDVLYYPYGASSTEHRHLMASNLIMWEAMRFGKRLGCQSFDLWGSLGPDPDPKDPWYGFHRFKEGYGGQLIAFVGSYDLVLLPQLYPLYCLADNIRWKWLRFIARFR